MLKRKKILWVGEFSLLNTGYSKAAKELLLRFHQSQKYEIAELACYMHEGDHRRSNLPWTLYGNMPSNDAQEATYNRVNCCQFGEWRFDDVCLDFQPDIIIDIRDPWMVLFETMSPFRHFYHLMLMPTIDSAPQMEQAHSIYKNADTIFAYSEYGKRVIEGESKGNIKVSDILPLGVNLNIYKPPLNKRQHRSNFGFLPNINIIGTVMRNQRRKLYPDLFKAFKKFLENPKFKDNTYLYLHTSYPDVGWDIPKLIKENHLSGKVLFTYICKNCNTIMPSFFKDARCVCPSCNTYSMQLPGTQVGVTEEQLASIYNLFDVYVQYAVCEGLGLPAIEAAACGIPIMEVNYSAMESVLKDLHGTPIAVEKLFRDSDTSSWRALPNNEDFIEKLEGLLILSKKEKGGNLRKTKDAVKRLYNWDIIAKKWMQYIDSVPLRDVKDTWKSPPRIMNNSISKLPHLPHSKLVRWCLDNILGHREYHDTFFETSLINDLNQGVSVKNEGSLYFNELSLISNRQQYAKFSPKELVNQLVRIREKRNQYEKWRCGIEQWGTPSFIRNKKV